MTPEAARPASSTWFVRVEAVNFDDFVFDTNQVSAIRGGSLLLLSSVAVAEAALTAWCTATGRSPAITAPRTVSKGGSIGLFRLVVPLAEAAASPVMDDACAAVRSAFARDPVLRHGTIMVDATCERGQGLPQVVERLVARNRWRQLQAPSLSPPAWNDDPHLIAPCAVDDLRPGTEPWTRPGTQEAIRLSASIHARLQHGREARQHFYRTLADGALAAGPDLRFTDDLQELSQDLSRGRLHGKLAVFYADGNGVGSHRAKCTLPQLDAFDKAVRGQREALLVRLIREMTASPAYRTPGGALRFETLLWGGDEFLFVVPAWAGWDFATAFFEHSSSWTLPPGGDRPSAPYTHAAGLVFCHAEAPLHRVRILASRLAQLGKDAHAGGRPAQNRLAYEVLESFDHTGEDLAGYRSRRQLGADRTDAMLIAPQSMPGVREAFAVLAAAVPRKRVHAIAQQLLTAQAGGSAADAHSTMDDAYRRHVDPSTHARNALATLSNAFGSDARLWMHLAALWDYLEI